ncbi:sister chromatid cohesion protein PDS5 homolog C isoform X2 [Rhododendron vialii]|uniref:sister chromatid cohesion protein PDS5 homolog C isoform X2 n=2 Tax=Rhododendron vialii TaxID=182163 RepID=UPI00265D6410|nr:sister chromatid cohesion protein PDS5 homolog C isoform X2 [Rhododendron vialii]
MAASSFSQVFQEELKDAGERLLTPPASTPELLILLDKVELLLSRVEQAPSKRTYDALLPLMKALIAPDLLRHSEIDVKVSVASCINEITRVTAPDAPYDDKQMQEIFELSVMALGKLSLASGRCYTKAVSILHNIAAVRSCLVMLDLEFDELIVEMFQLFLNTIRSDHPQSVFSDIEMIMSLVLEETEEIPLELIIPLLRSVKKGNQNISPTSWKLGENVLNKCADKLRPYLPPAVQFMGFDVGDFAEIVFSICQDASRSEHLNGLPISATGPSSSDDSQLKKASQTKGKRKRIPEKEEVPEMANGMENHGEELVGCQIKVWWPLDRRFYEGAISSFDPIKKKHKVLYADGDEEMLDLSTERWMFVSKSNVSEQDQGNDLPSSNVLSDTKMDSVDASSLPSPSHEMDAHNPLWNYVTIVEKKSDGGGNVTWQCNFCKVIKRGSYTRVRGHLLNSPSAGVRPCEKVTSKDVATMRRLEDNKAKGRKKKTDSADASSVPSPSDVVDTKNPSDDEDTKNPSNEVDTKNPYNEGDTSNPLWRYVTRLEKRRHGGGNVTWRCNFCNVVKKGSYTRVRGHLLNWQSAGVKPCEKVTHEDIATMQRLENEAVGRRK